MSENSHQDGWEFTAVQSLRVLNRVRILLWAGDYAGVRNELRRLQSDFGDQIGEALSVRRSAFREEKRVKREFVASLPNEEEWTQERIEIEASAEAAKASGILLVGQEFPFDLGGLARVLSLLDSRVAQATRKKKIIRDGGYREKHGRDFEESETEQDPLPMSVPFKTHDLSKFRYAETQIDTRKWEWRAYRLESHEVAFEELEHRLSRIPDVFFKLWDHSQIDDKPTAPYRFIGFSTHAFIEIRIFDSNRVLVQMVADQNVDPQVYRDRIFDALK